MTELPRKNDFTPFEVGTVFNPLVIPSNNIRRDYSSVSIRFPSRLEAMAIDPSKIATNKNLRYTPGQIDFGVGIYKKVSVSVLGEHGSIQISGSSERPTLVRHSAMIMQEALGINDGLSIDVESEVQLRHCGLGSSSSLIASVACAINELYGRPIPDRALVKYLAQNHGEEIDENPDMISPVQCIGGSAACGTYQGGLIVLAGESIVVKTMDLSDDYSAVIGVPKGFTYPDAKYLMDQEIRNLDKFLECGLRYGPTIAYRLFHECFPDMEEGSLRAIGDLIFDYRYNMGSIQNCSFVYPPIVEMSKSLADLKFSGLAEVLSLSSVGPGMFAITKFPEECGSAFLKSGFDTSVKRVHNGRYEVLNLASV